MTELLRLSAETARKRNWRLSTHVAESAEEFEMFTQGRGEMFDWLRRNQRDMSDCGRGSPVQHLERNGLLNENLLAVHVNFLGQDDASLLGKQKVSVVHCPRSHDFFGHQPFPREELVATGVNLCLGTDSLATVRKRLAPWNKRLGNSGSYECYSTGRDQPLELNLFEEMRAFAANHPALSPEEHFANGHPQRRARAGHGGKNRRAF